MCFFKENRSKHIQEYLISLHYLIKYVFDSCLTIIGCECLQTLIRIIIFTDTVERFLYLYHI